MPSPVPFSYAPPLKAVLPGAAAPVASKGPVPFKYVPSATPAAAPAPVAPVAAANLPGPKLGQGAAGDFAGNVVRSVAEPLINTGGLIEKGLDQTLGRVINTVKGKGAIPTTSGQQAEDEATASSQAHAGGFAGGAGDVVGAIAPYLTPAGPEEGATSLLPKAVQEGSTLIPKVAGFVARNAPTVIRDAAIGTAQTKSPVEGAAIGLGGAATKGAIDIAGKGISALLPKSAAETAEIAGKNLVGDATPAYSKTLIGEPAVRSVGPNGEAITTPRIQESAGKNPLKTRTVTSTPSEIAAGKELGTIPNYPAKGTALQKFNAIEPEIANRAQAVETSLENEHVLRPPAEVSKIVRDAVNGASENSLLLQKSDPIVVNYLRVANRAIANMDGTLKGEFQLRKVLDQAYDDAGGKYGNNKGLDQIHRAARNALTDDVEAKATNTAVKASLKSQSNLYNAADVLQDKARAEGGSALEQLMKAHPTGSKIVTGALKAVGLGAGLHLVP